MGTLRYLSASLCLGLITVWGSENLFWFAPPSDLTPGGWVVTWIAYALCAGASLSAALWSGLGGWRGVFLGGVLFGYLIEGVVVGTIYDQFPVQLVWTAMAWHGLFTALVLVGALRAAVHWPLKQHLGLLLAIAVFAAVFALFWPTERADLPGIGPVLVYVVAIGAVVPFSHVLLDRIGPIGPLPPLVLGILPLMAVLVWLWTTWVAFTPVRLAFPAVVGLTLWAMTRLGRPGPISLGRPAPLWRHFLFLLAPLAAVLVAVPLWEAGLRFPGNWVIFALTVPFSLGLWLWLLGSVLRQKPHATSGL